MSRYYSFNDYINDVDETADKLCLESYGLNLSCCTNTSEQTLFNSQKMLSKSWDLFNAVINLITNTNVIMLIVAITAFLTTPLGLIAIALFSKLALNVIKQIYPEKTLPTIIRNRRIIGKGEELPRMVFKRRL